MNDLENRYNAIKAKLRPYNILTIIGTMLVLANVVLTIVCMVVKNDTTKILSYVGLGVVGFVLIGFIILYVVYRNDLKEYKKIKDEMIIAKKKQ